MSSYSQNPSFSGIRKKTSSEHVSLISKNIKTGFLTVANDATFKSNLAVEGDVEVDGFSNLTSGFKVGTNGSDIYKVVAGTVSVNPGSIGAATRGSVNVTITGLSTSDRIFLHPPTGLNTELLYCGCDITASNTLTIYLYNKSGGSIDDTALTWKYSYLIFTD